MSNYLKISSTNDYNEIFNDAPDYGDLENEDFDYPDDQSDAYERHLVEEMIEQDQTKKRDKPVIIPHEVDAEETRCLLRDCS